MSDVESRSTVHMWTRNALKSHNIRNLFIVPIGYVCSGNLVIAVKEARPGSPSGHLVTRDLGSFSFIDESSLHSAIHLIKERHYGKNVRVVASRGGDMWASVHRLFRFTRTQGAQ